MTDNTPFVRADMRALLEMLKAAAGPPLKDLPVAEARQGYKVLNAMADRPARELPVIEDLTCPGPAGDIPLRLYDNRESREAGPVICHFHGGGFVIGDLDTHHALCTELAVLLDLPVVAVDYRLAPEHPFPAAIEDCEAAARWVAGNPAELAREATGLILLGDSAGGNASIVVSQLLGANPANVPAILQVPLFPLAADTEGSASLEQFAEGYVLTKESIEFFNEAYGGDKNDPRCIPTLGDHSTTPPTILVTASLDPIRDSGREYGAALSQAGISHIHLEVQGVTHSFTNLRQGVPSAQKDLERIVKAMKFMLEEA